MGRKNRKKEDDDDYFSSLAAPTTAAAPPEEDEAAEAAAQEAAERKAAAAEQRRLKDEEAKRERLAQAEAVKAAMAAKRSKMKAVEDEEEESALQTEEDEPEDEVDDSKPQATETATPEPSGGEVSTGLYAKVVAILRALFAMIFGGVSEKKAEVANDENGLWSPAGLFQRHPIVSPISTVRRRDEKYERLQSQLKTRGKEQWIRVKDGDGWITSRASKPICLAYFEGQLFECTDWLSSHLLDVKGAPPEFFDAAKPVFFVSREGEGDETRVVAKLSKKIQDDLERAAAGDEEGGGAAPPPKKEKLSRAEKKAKKLGYGR